MTKPKETIPETDHNVYILGAGFSYEAGYPLIGNFMDIMREAFLAIKDKEYGLPLKEVLDFRLKASSAAYRTRFDPENVEDLFSLATATENNKNSMAIAIAETLAHCKRKKINRTSLLQNSSG